LTVAAQDPISKIPQYKVCAARLRKADGPPDYEGRLEPQQ
jgi:assimilatory nitrate reductase catalytic subunit